QRSHRLCPSSISEAPPATRTLALMSVQQRGERGRLRDGHDCFERQRAAMRIVPIGDPADGMTQDLDGRLRQVLIVVCRTSLAEILELPGFLRAGLDVYPRFDAGELAY